jgi:menaquinone-dependent protoporphyrinogen oxidase
MSKVLVTYATKTGCTQGIAEKVGQVLEGRGASVDVVPIGRQADPSGYDAVVVGSGARIGKWHGSAIKWVSGNAEALKSVPVAFFTACLTLADSPEKTDEVRKYSDPAIEGSGVEPVDIGLFAGWFVPEEFGAVGRAVLKKMESPEGDHRDWAAIEAWAGDVASKLGV